MADTTRRLLRSCMCCDEPAGLSRRGFLASALSIERGAALKLLPRLKA